MTGNVRIGPSIDDGEKDTLSAALKGAAATLRRRWRLLLLVAGVVFAAVVVALFLITPRYEAIVRVKIDPSRSAAMGQLTDQPAGMPDQTIVDTEASVMRSIDIARAVTVKLNLIRNQEFTDNLDPLPANPSPALMAERVDEVAGRLLKHMAAEREKATYVVDISFESLNADTAARIANAFAEQYIDYTVGARSGTAERQAKSLDERLKEMSDEVSRADEQLAQYRAKTGVVDSESGGQSVTDQQIASLATQLATAESEAAAARSKLDIARSQIRSGGIDNVSAVLSSEVVRNLRAQRAQLIASQGEIATRYGPKHPEFVKITQQLQAIDEQIADEAKRVVGGLDSEATAASARAASLRSDLAVLKSNQSVDLRATAQVDTLKRHADTVQAGYNRLSAQAQSAGTIANSSLSQAQIIEAATPPSSPSKPAKGKLLAAGFLLALFCGTGVVCIQELLATGLRTVSDLRKLGLDVLATVPSLGADSGLPAERMVDKPMSSYAEAFRVLRGSLSLGSGHSPQVIAITSTLPDEGKTTTALSLARVMGLAGESVLVIDADLRRAGVRSATGVEGTAGLVELLHGEAELEQVIQQDRVPSVSLLTVAASHFSPEDLFRGDGMANLLGTLRKRYNHIIIDTPPLLGVADARTLSTLADAVILVVRWNTTPRNAVKTSIEWLNHDQANLVGAVYSMVDASVEAYGALYYSSKYAQYYTPDK